MSSTKPIAAKGGPSKTSTIRWTIWGPIVVEGRARAVNTRSAGSRMMPTRWHRDITKPERARTVDELLAAVAGLGIPNQNVDDGGYERPDRVDDRRRDAEAGVGHDGMTPESWADGKNRWDGYLTAAEFPALSIPAAGASGPPTRRSSMARCCATIGEGGYADGIRARMIRDRLMRIDKATPQDMLAIQLEDRALFLERWRKLLLDELASANVEAVFDTAR